MAKYYVLCDDDCRHEGMNREQIIAAIEQALEQGFVSDPDEAVISKLREIRSNGAVQLWVGSEQEFNALSPAPDISRAFVRIGKNGVVYLCPDDDSAKAFEKHMGDTNNPHNVTIEQVLGGRTLGVKLSGTGTKTDNRWVDGKAIYAKAITGDYNKRIGGSIHINLSDFDVDTFIGAVGNVAGYPIGYYYEGSGGITDFVRFRVNLEGKYCILWTNQSIRGKFSVILYYTKIEESSVVDKGESEPGLDEIVLA